MPSHSRVLFIGLDSADKDLLHRWIADGSLPTFRSIMAEGAWADVLNFPVFGSNVTWTSLFSGLNPGNHGLYYFDRIKKGTYELESFHPTDLKVEPFWNSLSRAGRRVAIIDVPQAPLSTDLNGIHVVDWAAHDAFFRPALSTPRELISEIEVKYGADPVGSCDHYQNSVKDKITLRDRLFQRIDKKTDLVCEFLQREPWDLFMTVFQEAHCIGHQCWHIHDPSHKDHPVALARAIGDPVKDVYVALDQAIAKILGCTDANTRVVLYAGPGMQKNYTGNHILDEVLRRRDSDSPALDRQILARCKDAVKFPVRALPAPIRRPIMRFGKRLEKRQATRDWKNRTCFLLLPHNDISGAIRLNLVGREPHGRIEPQDVDDFVAQLTEDLLDVVNVDTGRPFIRNVFRTSDICYGERLDDLPDLFVEWNSEAPISSVWSRKIGLVKRKLVAIRTGDHASHCAVFARGPGVRPGPVSRNVTVMDLAPTLSAMLGVSLDNVDGTPIQDLLVPTEAFIQAGAS